MRTLDQVHGADHVFTARAPFDQVFEILAALDQLEPRILCEPLQLVELVGGALIEAAPRPDRPARRDREGRDAIGVVGVAVVVLPARALGRRAEDLQRDVAAFEPRQVHLADLRFLREVPPPQHRVRVQVGDEQRLVQRPRLVADRVRLVRLDGVEARLELGRQESDRVDERRDEQDRKPGE